MLMACETKTKQDLTSGYMEELKSVLDSGLRWTRV
jgi:hypothetical protein